jgi:uncharacterized protein
VRQQAHAKIIEVVLRWARAQPTICAGALVGSHARGTARADSDIDLVALTTAPDLFRGDPEWIRAIDWSRCEASPATSQDEEYGQLWSRRIWLMPDRYELEIGFALLSWADVHPLDAGTRQVVADGCRFCMTRMVCSLAYAPRLIPDAMSKKTADARKRR